MAITVKVLEDSKKVDKAELHISLNEMPVSEAEYLAALKVIDSVRDKVLEHLGVTEEDADVTDVRYAFDGKDAVVTILQMDR